MAVSKSPQQVTWDAGSFSKLFNAGNKWDSDAMEVPNAAFVGELTVKASIALGSPGVNDTLTIKLLKTTGDPDAHPDSTDEYDTPAHADILGVLDLNAEPEGGSGPSVAIFTVPISAGMSWYRVRGEANASLNAAGATLSAQASWVLG